jgi:hypothetical protein
MADLPATKFESVLDAECADLHLPGKSGTMDPTAAAQAAAPATSRTKAPIDPRRTELHIPSLDVEDARRIEITGIVGDRIRWEDFLPEAREKPKSPDAGARTAHVDLGFDLGRIVGKPAVKTLPAPRAAGIIEVTGLPRRIGLALSGGGIRSATFSLGVLQALAFRGKLTGLDYLSTVSGGGYIGSWLTAWILRADANGGLEYVQQQLGACVVYDRAIVNAGIALRSPAPPQPDVAPKPQLVEPPEVTWLRRYSNYLAPRVGALSTDSLTLVTTWFRNTLLNLVIIVAALAAVFTLIHLLAFIPNTVWKDARSYFGGAAFLAAVVLLIFVSYNLVKISGRKGDYGGAWAAPVRVKLMVWTLGLVAALCGALWFFNENPNFWLGLSVLMVLLMVVAAGWLVLVAREAFATGGTTDPPVADDDEGEEFVPLAPENFPVTGEPDAPASAAPKRDGSGRRSVVPWENLGQFTVGAVAALVTTALLFWGFTIVADGPSFAGVLTWGPAMVLLGFGVAGSVFVGISGRAYFERSREWWSRMNALVFAAGVAWLVVFWIALYARPFVDWVFLQFPVWSKVLTAGWVGTIIAIVKARAPAGASSRTRLNVERGITALAFVALVGFITAVALATDYFVLEAARMWQPDAFDQAAPLGEHLDARSDLLAGLPDHADYFWRVALLFFGLVGAFWVFIRRVDVNKFSLHNMYKNRLVRCYLGASRGTARNAQPFTGFDEADDVELGVIPSGQRPYHILNAALNLSQGSNLAWQERKSASFIFSPKFCGYELAQTQGDTTQRFLDDGTQLPPGYCPTAEYATKSHESVRVEERALTLGSVLATSGAAVSPNMGAGTNSLRAFMLTVLNARLGRWCPNPAGTAHCELSPPFGFAWFLQELFGATNESSRYVYLSDGGHFENLGLYELVRRKCSHIVVVDAAADPERSFGDLGRAIRQCRVDLGAEIELDLRELRPGARDKLSTAGFAWGRIRYDQKSNPPKTAALLYIKPTLTRRGGEPVDVLAYAARNSTFPQQTTADQFFDESQFESYRRLGVHIGLGAIDTPNGAMLPEAPPEAQTAPEDQDEDATAGVSVPPAGT